MHIVYNNYYVVKCLSLLCYVMPEFVVGIENRILHIIIIITNAII